MRSFMNSFFILFQDEGGGVQFVYAEYLLLALGVIFNRRIVRGVSVFSQFLTGVCVCAFVCVCIRTHTIHARTHTHCTWASRM